MKCDVIIIGGGAAGLMCAAVAGARGLKVMLLEHNKQVGRKILISGGGRCNFTNREVDGGNFYSQNEHFSKSALTRYTPYDFIDLVEKHGISYFEKTLGQLFCDKSAKDIIKMLLTECDKSQVEVKVNQKVSEVIKEQDEFLITTNHGEYRSNSLVIATGGLSIAQIGASDFGYRLAKQFGLRLKETRPALVPFTMKGFNDLSGVSLPCRMKTSNIEFDEALLFTHKGLSGPVTLQASLYWEPGTEVIVNFLPDQSVLDLLLKAKKSQGDLKVLQVLRPYFPSRFIEKFCQLFLEDHQLELANQKLSQIECLAQNLNSWTFIPDGTEGYRKAEVTRGGVQVDELSSKSMESKKVPGLFFIGEVVDVTGWLGGYNFQWAWASGNAAGSSV